MFFSIKAALKEHSFYGNISHIHVTGTSLENDPSGYTAFFKSYILILKLLLNE